jgi:hypothetical protein
MVISLIGQAFRPFRRPFGKIRQYDAGCPTI